VPSGVTAALSGLPDLLELTIIEASGLHASSMFGGLDPYVIIVRGADTAGAKKTPVKSSGGSAPVWYETFSLPVDAKSDELKLLVKDKALAALGEAVVRERVAAAYSAWSA
jgi:Ca2+-dependent lipid-binding protein